MMENESRKISKNQRLIKIAEMDSMTKKKIKKWAEGKREGRAEANLRRCLCFWQLSQEPNRNSCAIMQLLIETQSHF